MNHMIGQGFSAEQARGMVSQMVDAEAVALATGHLFVLAAGLFTIASMIIWLAPRPTRAVDTSLSH